ncbi:hypothetical protein KCU71_g791, partial [Aureobasidium melanogenum]
MLDALTAAVTIRGRHAAAATLDSTCNIAGDLADAVPDSALGSKQATHTSTHLAASTWRFAAFENWLHTLSHYMVI